ncbi:hypothetical protein ACHWQZ_G015297 [Mnemiopsis leidyi]
MDYNNNTSLQTANLSLNFTPSSAADTTFGLIYVTCSIFGMAGNLAVFRYFFSRSHKDISTCLYLCTSLNDTTVSFMVVFVAASFFNDRNPTWFQSDGVCLCWGIMYRVVQRMAMFLTGTLSVTRTFSLLFPLREVSKRFVLMVVGVYFAVNLVHDTVMAGLSIFVPNYAKWDVYCFPSNNNKHHLHEVLDDFDNMTYTLQIFLPATIVVISCLTAINAVRSSKQNVPNASNDQTSQNIKHKATMTIIIITIVHIIFSTPMVINYIFWTISKYKNSWPEPFYTSNIMFNYSWNFTDIMCLALNAMINPLILLTRSTREVMQFGEDKIVEMTDLVDEELAIVNRRMTVVIAEAEHRLEEGIREISKKVNDNHFPYTSEEREMSCIGGMIETNLNVTFKLNLVPEELCLEAEYNDAL